MFPDVVAGPKAHAPAFFARSCNAAGLAVSSFELWGVVMRGWISLLLISLGLATLASCTSEKKIATKTAKSSDAKNRVARSEASKFSEARSSFSEAHSSTVASPGRSIESAHSPDGAERAVRARTVAEVDLAAAADTVRITEDNRTGPQRFAIQPPESPEASIADTVKQLPQQVRAEMRHRQAPARPAYRAGTLTAGSFDDHARYNDYREYLSAALQRDAEETLPRLGLGERIVVRVVNGKDEPVNNARVVLHSPADQRDVAEQRTTSDGRAVFSSELDRFAAGAQLVARILSPDEAAAGIQPITQTIDRAAAETTLCIVGAPRDLPQQLDLSLVIDTTGSMADELEYLKTEIDAIAAMVHKRFPNVDQRYSLVVYRDEGDEYIARKFDFAGSLSEFRSSLSAQSASGGGDYPEAMHLALEQADACSWRNNNTARVMFLVADAPPHRRFAGRTVEAVKKLRAKGVTIFPVAASGAQDEPEFVLRGAAFLTRGRYLFLTDHSGVGNAHARPHVPEYEVERLDQLMIRMIAWKLTGEESGTQEILATSYGDEPATGAAPPIEQNNKPESGAQVAPTVAARGTSSSMLWSAISSLRPNRWWLLPVIVLVVIVLDRREVRRRKEACEELEAAAVTQWWPSNPVR
jgi:hypothetical protein